MKINAIDVEATLDKTKVLLGKETDLSPALRSVIEVLLMLVSVLLNHVTLNSHNSSKPPSSDPNRKKNKRAKTGKPSGGQHGQVGTTLQTIADPGHVTIIKVDQSTLPKGAYRDVGVET